MDAAPLGHPAPDGPADEVLLARFVAGDPDAFGELVRRHQDLVYAICWRFFRDDADAEDATQETFVAAHRGAASFKGSARFTTWLYRVATNTCHDVVRRRVRRPQSAGVDPESLGAHAGDDIEALEVDLDLRRALERLSAEHREVIVLHVLGGVPYAEIAERTGVAMGTVKSRIHRASAHLARLLADHDPAEHLPSAVPHSPDDDPPRRPNR